MYQNESGGGEERNVNGFGIEIVGGSFQHLCSSMTICQIMIIVLRKRNKQETKKGKKDSVTFLHITLSVCSLISVSLYRVGSL